MPIDDLVVGFGEFCDLQRNISDIRVNSNIIANTFTYDEVLPGENV